MIMWIISEKSNNIYVFIVYNPCSMDNLTHTLGRGIPYASGATKKRMPAFLNFKLSLSFFD